MKKLIQTWWRHQMETFSALLALCVGNSPVTSEFSARRPVSQSFDIFFDLHLNKQLSKQSLGWWSEMPSCPSWRYCNESVISFQPEMFRCQQKQRGFNRISPLWQILCHLLSRKSIAEFLVKIHSTVSQISYILLWIPCHEIKSIQKHI